MLKQWHRKLCRSTPRSTSVFKSQGGGGGKQSSVQLVFLFSQTRSQVSSQGTARIKEQHMQYKAGAPTVRGSWTGLFSILHKKI